MSEITKKYNKLSIIFKVLSILLFIAPVSYFTVTSLIGGCLVTQKFALVSCVLVSIMMTLISFVNKNAMRSRIWIIILGIYFCCDRFALAIILVSITQILDEVIVNPLYKKFKQKAIINKEFDKRTG